MFVTDVRMLRMEADLLIGAPDYLSRSQPVYRSWERWEMVGAERYLYNIYIYVYTGTVFVQKRGKGDERRNLTEPLGNISDNFKTFCFGMKRCFRVAFVQLSGWKTWNFGASWFKRLQTHGSELPPLTATNVDKKRFDAASLCNNQQMFRPPSFIFTTTRITINWRNTVHMGFFKSEPSVLLTFAMSLADVAAAWIGYAVIAGACVVKLPQILLIVSNSSAEGLSEMAAALDAVAASSFSYYNLLKGYPIAGWGSKALSRYKQPSCWSWFGFTAATIWRWDLHFSGYGCALAQPSFLKDMSATFYWPLWVLRQLPWLPSPEFLKFFSIGRVATPDSFRSLPSFCSFWKRCEASYNIATYWNDALTLISHSVGAILNLVVVLQILAHHNQLKLAVKAAKVNIVALEKSVWDVSEWWVWWADSRKMRPGLADVFSSSAALRAVTIVGPVIEGQRDDGENLSRQKLREAPVGSW